MTRSLAFHIRLALAGLGLMLNASASPLRLDPAELDHGAQLQQQVLNSEVTVTNVTDQPLRIVSVQADCGCTVPEIGTKELAAGASTTLHVRFETRTFYGALQRRVTLNTDQGLVTLPVRANISPYADWEIAPMPAVLPPSLPHAAATTVITLRYTGPGRAQPISAKPNLPWLEAALTPTETTGLFHLTLTKKADAPVGNNSAVIAIHTDSASAPLISLHAIVPVASALRVAPNPIVLPRVRVGTPTSVFFKLKGWSDAGEPRVVATKGELRALGLQDGEFTYELSYTPEAVGTRFFPVRVYRGEQLELDLSAVARGDPVDD